MMRQARKKSALIFLLIVSIVLWSCGMAGCGRPGSTGGFSGAGAPAANIDQRLVGGVWKHVTEYNAEAVVFLSDGTYRQILISHYPNFRTWWFNHYVGKYKVDGNKIIFYETKRHTTKTEEQLKYSVGDYDVVEEVNKNYGDNEPVPDSTITYQIKDANKAVLGKGEFDRVKGGL